MKKLCCLLIYLFVLAGCVSSTDSDVIEIGAVLPLTGIGSIYSQFNKEGISLAVDEINDNGGINGKMLGIRYEDSESSTRTAVNALTKVLDQEKVPMSFVGFSSPETMAQSPIAENYKIPIIALGSAAEKIRYSGEYVFRLKVSVDVETKKLMDFVHDELNSEKLYVISMQNDYGESVKQFAKKYFEEKGGKVIGEEDYLVEEKDFRNHLLKAKNSKADTILIIGFGRNTGHLMKQARELEIKANFVTTEGGISPEVIDIAGNASNGLMYSSEYALARDTKKVKSYKKKYFERYGREPELFSALGYDGVYILADILKKCTDSECIKESLYSVKDFEGVSGNLSFDSYGDVVKPIHIMQIQNQTFVEFNQ